MEKNDFGNFSISVGLQTKQTVGNHFGRNSSISSAFYLVVHQP